MRKCFFIIFVSLDSVKIAYEVSSAMNLPAASYGVSKWMMAYLPPPSPYPLPKERVFVVTL